MAAPTYKAKGTAGQTQSGTSFSFTYPTVAANDLLFLMILECDLKNITVNPAWTQRVKKFIPSGSPTMALYIYSKLATGSESGSESVTRTSGGSTFFGGQIYSYDGDNYITIENISSNAGTSDTVTWSAVTLGGTERTLAAFSTNFNTTTSLTTPTGYTNNADETLSTLDYDVVFELNTKANVSSDGAVTATGGSLDGWGTAHIAIYNNTPTGTGGSRSFIVN
jgi:hypothetical protein